MKQIKFLNIFKILNLMAVTLAMSCTSKPTKVRIESSPTAAEVYLNNKLISKTPVELDSEKYKTEFAKPYLDIKLSQNGYEGQSVLISTKSVQTFKINLKPFDKLYFESKLLSNFQTEANELVREILQIQGLIVAQQIDQAEEKNTSFLKRYPNIAAGYVLQSSIEMAKDDKAKAVRNLQRALSLDPQDPVVLRALSNLKKGTSQ